MAVINLLTFAKVWEGTFKYYGLPPIAVYILLPFFFVLGCWYVGYLYDVKGLWKSETKFSNRKQNPELFEIYETVMEDHKIALQSQKDMKKIKEFLNIKDKEV
jgi:hypothetical protein